MRRLEFVSAKDAGGYELGDWILREHVPPCEPEAYRCPICGTCRPSAATPCPVCP